MGDYHYKCVCCDLPILGGMECVTVYIRNGKREMNTLLVGKWHSESDIQYDEVTEKYSSKEEFERNKAFIEEENEKEYGKFGHVSHWHDTEKNAQTGYSAWHLYCLEKELNVNEIFEYKKECLERERDSLREIFPDQKEVAETIYQERMKKIQNLPLFENELLTEKFRWHSLWNQNLVSQVGQFYYGDAVTEIEKGMKEFVEFLARSGIYGDGDTGEYYSDDLTDILVKLDIPIEVLEKALHIQKERKGEEDDEE